MWLPVLQPMPAPRNQRNRQPVAVAAGRGQFGAMLLQKPAQVLDLPAMGIGDAPAFINGVLDDPGLAQVTITAARRAAQYVAQEEVHVLHRRAPM